MDMRINQRIMQLEKEANEIREEINAINFRVANDRDNLDLLKVSTKQLKQLNKDLAKNNKEMKKVLKDVKK